MLGPAIVLSATGGLQLSGDYLLEAQRRRSSNARAAFSAAVRDPILKDPTYNPLELVSLIAAEESCADVSVMPHHVSSRIRSQIEQLIAPAAQRLSLDRAMGSVVEPEVVCGAVATVLFGSQGAPDDAESEKKAKRLSEATHLARSVLPVPGGPKRSTPRGGAWCRALSFDVPPHLATSQLDGVLACSLWTCRCVCVVCAGSWSDRDLRRATRSRESCES